MTALPYAAYILCTSPRSGSTLLCEMLRRTGQAGWPESHFHDTTLSGWLRDHDLDPDQFTNDDAARRAVFAAAHRKGKRDGVLFGLRMQRDSFGFFMAQLARLHPGTMSDAARIEHAFGPTCFVYLTRTDKVAQAISYIKASQSGLWHRNADGTEYERLAPPSDLVYDGARIHRQVKAFSQMDKDWEAWFAAQGVAPLRLTYGPLSAQPATTVAKVLERLGLNGALVRDMAPPMARLADATSRDWAARYRAERAA